MIYELNKKKYNCAKNTVLENNYNKKEISFSIDFIGFIYTSYISEYIIFTPVT